MRLSRVKPDQTESPDGRFVRRVLIVLGLVALTFVAWQLRSVLRTCAVDGDDPGRVLDRLDRLVTTFAMADLATVVYARITRRPDGSAELSWSNAGHPPPLLLTPGQPARFLDTGTSTMVGVELYTCTYVTLYIGVVGGMV